MPKSLKLTSEAQALPKKNRLYTVKKKLIIEEFRIHCRSIGFDIEAVMIVVIHTESRRRRQEKCLRYSALSVEKNRVRKHMLRDQSST